MQLQCVYDDFLTLTGAWCVYPYIFIITHEGIILFCRAFRRWHSAQPHLDNIEQNIHHEFYIYHSYIFSQSVCHYKTGQYMSILEWIWGRWRLRLEAYNTQQKKNKKRKKSNISMGIFLFLTIYWKPLHWMLKRVSCQSIRSYNDEEKARQAQPSERSSWQL